MASIPRFLGPARSLCPVCLREAPGGYFSEAGKVVLRRRCEVHGATGSPFWDDVDHFEWTRRLDAEAGTGGACCAPGTPGCDPASGLKRCVTVLPITDGCNLTCPYCFAASQPRNAHRGLDEIEGMLRGALREGGGPTPLQVSGGEPTVHPEFLDVVRRARGLGYSHIEVNTNGLRVASQEGFADEIRGAGADVLYLQFDGLSESSYVATRGLDLVEAKGQAIDAARDAGLRVVLAPTIVPGRNDHEVGAIVRFALDHRDVVRGVNFQPVRHLGRFAEDTGHLSPDRVAKALAEQTGFLRAEDLVPFPCCSAACYLATILVRTGNGIVAATRLLPEDAYVRAVTGIEDRRYLDILTGGPDMVRVAERVACDCGIPLPAGFEGLFPDALAVSVTSFMDAHTVDLDRMGRCCIRVATRTGRLAPFCGYYLTDAGGAYAWRNRNFPEDATLPLRASSPEVFS